MCTLKILMSVVVLSLLKNYDYIFKTFMNNPINKSYVLLIISIKCTSEIQYHISVLIMS